MADTPMADPDPELVIAADFAQALSNYGPPHLTPQPPPPLHLQALAQRCALLASWHRGSAQSDSFLFQQLVLFTYNACQYVNRAPHTLAEADLVIKTVCNTFQPCRQRFPQTSPSSQTARPLIQDLLHILRNSPQGQTLVANSAASSSYQKGCCFKCR